jgi:diphthamide synthase (EF-2-diphthine--ammonia ligase)
VFPLWGLSRVAVAAEVIAAGIKARLVCVDAGRLSADFCGAEYDAGLLARLPVDVCPCGEGGEFHTFVRDAPCFRYPLSLGRGPQRRVRSVPPLAPTDLVFEVPELAPA